MEVTQALQLLKQLIDQMVGIGAFKNIDTVLKVSVALETIERALKDLGTIKN